MAQKGWSGNIEGHKKAGSLGGRATVEKYGIEHFKKIGTIGGKNKYDKWKYRQNEK